MDDRKDYWNENNSSGQPEDTRQVHTTKDGISYRHVSPGEQDAQTDWNTQSGQNTQNSWNTNTGQAPQNTWNTDAGRNAQAGTTDNSAADSGIFRRANEETVAINMPEEGDSVYRKQQEEKEAAESLNSGSNDFILRDYEAPEQKNRNDTSDFRKKNEETGFVSTQNTEQNAPDTQPGSAEHLGEDKNTAENENAAHFFETDSFETGAYSAQNTAGGASGAEPYAGSESSGAGNAYGSSQIGNDSGRSDDGNAYGSGRTYGTWPEWNGGASGTGPYGESQNGNTSYGGNAYGNDSYGGAYGGSSYGSSDGGYYHTNEPNDAGGGSSYGTGGNGGNDWDGPHYTAPESKPGKGKKSKKAAAQPIQLTRKSFVLTLIVCMIISAAAAFAASTFYVNHNSASGSATNYTLSSSEESLSYSSIISKTQDSVVSITTESVSTDLWAGNYVTEGAGSGVIIQSNGYILTCNHVIEDASKITVTLNNSKSYSAKVVGANSDKDIAVLKISATGLTAATYGDSSKLKVGDQVVVIGNPLGKLGGSASTGIISALNRNLTIDGKSMNLLQTDASVNPGNSGGAMFNSSGNLVGIVVAKSTGSDVEGLGFAIPVNTAAKVAKDLIENGSSSSDSGSSNDSDSSSGTTSSTPKIGITVATISESQAQQNNLDGAGLYVTSVTSDNAKEAGFMAMDKIVSADGSSISTYTDLRTVLQKHKSGDTIKIVISRKGTMQTLSAKLQ